MSVVFLINLIIGVIAGVLAGMFGIGGGAVIVPALIVFSDFTLNRQTDIACRPIAAGWGSCRNILLPGWLFKYQDCNLGRLWIMCGSNFRFYDSSRYAYKSSKLCYGIFLLYISYSFLNPRDIWYKYILKKANPYSKPKNKEPKPKLRFYWFLMVGVIAGVLSGLFGIGGGLVIVPF